MKEKIWMEKLIELYYEYGLNLLKRDMYVNWATEREIEVADIEKVDEDELEKNLNKLSDLKPFIKWLVENDKIDHWKLSNYIIDNKFFWDKITELKEYESLLMLLSISDTPIEDLISYLK